MIFELTETAVVSDIEEASRLLTQLTKQGCLIFVDDYGVGYSSLNLICSLPISGIKIDKMFVSDNSKHNVIESIILLAETMNLMVIAEGIETQDQLDYIKSHGAKQKGQGFYLARPMMAERLVEFIERSKRD